MKIQSTYSHTNPEIEIIEINGELKGRGAIRFEKYLYSSLDEGLFSKILDLKQMKRADGLGLNILENFIRRGMRIRLYNAGLEMQMLLKISGKEEIIKIYNCQEADEAVLLFEKEILEEKSPDNQNIKRRDFKRRNTSLQVAFHGNNSDKGNVSYKAIIENLSEGGALIRQIDSINKRAGPRRVTLEMVAKSLCNFHFTLNSNDDSKLIETNGECVWAVRENEKQYAGVRFRQIEQNHAEMIKEYVCRHKSR
ncbi:MAG: hypothetical protein HND49_07015 [Planctomycetes bacterium]|nr:hypothetical protein [Planctomycetota bacterium]